MKYKFNSLLAFAIAAVVSASPPVDAKQCPATPGELQATLSNESKSDRAESAKCFVERSTHFPLAELHTPIATLLTDADPDVRLAGLEILASSLWTGTATNAQVSAGYTRRLQNVLRADSSARNRILAATVLVHVDALHEGQLRGPLMKLLASPDPAVSDAALDNLIKLGNGSSPEVKNVLLSKAKSSSQRQRQQGYRGLGRTQGNKNSISNDVLLVLRSGLKDQGLESKIQAAHALGALHQGGAAAEADLQRIVWDPHQPASLRRAAQDAVELITGKPIRAPWVSGAQALPVAPKGASGAEPTR